MEMARDVVIVVSGVAVTVAAILIAVLAYSLYRDLKAITKSIKTTTAKIEALVTFATDEVARPLLKFAGIVQGITHGIGAVRKIFKKGE